MQQLFEKYINYEIATSVVALIFAVILFVCAIFGIKLTKYFNSRSDDDFILATVIGALTVCSFIFSVITIGTEIFDIITCYTFPEKMVIEQLIYLQNQG